MLCRYVTSSFSRPRPRGDTRSIVGGTGKGFVSFEEYIYGGVRGTILKSFIDAVKLEQIRRGNALIQEKIRALVNCVEMFNYWVPKSWRN